MVGSDVVSGLGVLSVANGLKKAVLTVLGLQSAKFERFAGIAAEVSKKPWKSSRAFWPWRTVSLEHSMECLFFSTLGSFFQSQCLLL
jgi:hypothetical protein